jgi:hypothetical protein
MRKLSVIALVAILLAAPVVAQDKSAEQVCSETRELIPVLEAGLLKASERIGQWADLAAERELTPDEFLEFTNLALLVYEAEIVLVQLADISWRCELVEESSD